MIWSLVCGLQLESVYLITIIKVIKYISHRWLACFIYILYVLDNFLSKTAAPDWLVGVITLKGKSTKILSA